MFPFPISLIHWHDHIQMKFIFLALNHLSHGLFHLSNQVNVQLTVELVPLILLESFDLLALSKVLPDDPYNCLLHLFLQYMVLTLGVYLVQEFLFALLVGVIRFFLRHSYS
jgi:hypothetical protein